MFYIIKNYEQKFLTCWNENNELVDWYMTDNKALACQYTEEEAEEAILIMEQQFPQFRAEILVPNF
jgi:hypothetical protein